MELISFYCISIDLKSVEIQQMSIIQLYSGLTESFFLAFDQIDFFENLQKTYSQCLIFFKVLNLTRSTSIYIKPNNDQE